ncbi:LytTR family DNA-binding domain-containing protein [Larkinella harenae]
MEEARELSRSKPYSMIWLDVSLTPQYELEHLRSLAKDVPVIVSSTSADLAVDGFEAGVADYLLKPFTFLRFIRAVNRALTVHASASIPEEHPFLFLKKGHTFQRFDHDHIDYIQAYGIYCKINGAGKMEVVNDTISRLEQVLPSQQFLRIHKSYIVNLSKVTGYSYRSISVGPHELPLGAAYRERFQGFLSLLGKKEGE